MRENKGGENVHFNLLPAVTVSSGRVCECFVTFRPRCRGDRHVVNEQQVSLIVNHH